MSSGNRLITAGSCAVLAILAAGFALRAATPDTGRPSGRSTMGALDARRADKLSRQATGSPGKMFTDSLEKSPRKGDLLRRIGAAADSTYLASMLSQVDSAIRRWPDGRVRRPLRVAIMPAAPVEGYRDEFATAVSWSVTRWNCAALAVGLAFRGHDTTRADIVVSWAPALDSGRTGKADVTWDRRQHIRRAAITLATHAPDGRPLTPAEMTALALHELGHAIGLAHSREARDALYPMTRAADLTARDRATARLLYELPAGSLRN